MADTWPDRDGSPSSSLTWMPPIMFFLALSLGTCCLFFMSAGGFIFCVLHFVLGSLVALVTFGTRSKNSQLMAIFSVFGNTLYLLLLACTFVYAAWLLGRNARATRDFDNGTSSPLISPLIDLYAGAVAGDNDAEESRRLQDAEAPFTGRPGHLQEQLAAASPIETSTFGLKDDFVRGLPTQLKGASPVDAMMQSARLTLEELQRSDKESVSPTVLRQGPPTRFDGLKFSKADGKCLLELETNEKLRINTFKRLHAFLDWGLFCGFTKYSVGALHRWPIACEDVCHLNLLNFSQHGEDLLSILQQAAYFKKAIESMGEQEIQMCAALTVVTACRMEQTKFPAGTMAALCLALLVSFCLFFTFISYRYQTSVRDCALHCSTDSSTLIGAAFSAPQARLLTLMEKDSAAGCKAQAFMSVLTAQPIRLRQLPHLQSPPMSDVFHVLVGNMSFLK
ncbi:hypothetical protein Efla_001450 [Eimeria flavescens]